MKPWRIKEHVVLLDFPPLIPLCPCCWHSALHSALRRVNWYPSFILEQLFTAPIYSYGYSISSGYLMCFGNGARNTQALSKENLWRRKVRQQASHFSPYSQMPLVDPKLEVWIKLACLLNRRIWGELLQSPHCLMVAYSKVRWSAKRRHQPEESLTNFETWKIVSQTCARLQLSWHRLKRLVRSRWLFFLSEIYRQRIFH